ncbi:MAG: hypothetical protein IKV47_00655 [Oscillospiraceae bacterium]|nr:hypothetical protein [Oscillospiraceae bacterium]
MKKEAFEKIKNWWWYHKIHVLIGVLALAVVIYSFAQSSGKQKADYDIGLLLAVPCAEEYLNSLPEILAAAGEDTDGNGEVTVELHTYFVDLADECENAGALNYEKIASLEADLIGGTSAMFITDSPDALLALTEGIFDATVIPFDGYWLCIRVDADTRYMALANELTN